MLYVWHWQPRPCFCYISYLWFLWLAFLLTLSYLLKCHKSLNCPFPLLSSLLSFPCLDPCTFSVWCHQNSWLQLQWRSTKSLSPSHTFLLNSRQYNQLNICIFVSHGYYSLNLSKTEFIFFPKLPFFLSFATTYLRVLLLCPLSQYIKSVFKFH